MKKKSIIGILFAGALTFMTTSCADIFDIGSNRVVYEHVHDLGSTADSVYSITGILHNLQQIADRYIILGEVRGDMVDVNDNTKASLRNLSNFNFDDDNEYLQVADYYNVINNCNYLLNHMDTTLRHNNERVMIDEYVAALSIRAWTYMQLAINYGKVPFFENPITTVAASEKDYPMLDIKAIADTLITELLPYQDYKMPKWSGIKAGGIDVDTQLFPPIQLVLGDLYLWTGDYQNAWYTYHDYITNNPEVAMNIATGSETMYFDGVMPLGPGQVTTDSKLQRREFGSKNWYSYTGSLAKILGYGSEAITVVPMESSTQIGTISEVPSLFYSTDETHQLVGSALWQEVSDAQDYCLGGTTATAKATKSYSFLGNKGDQRINSYIREFKSEEEEFEVVNKFYDGTTAVSDGSKTIYTIAYLTLYRRCYVYLRAAEALNCLAYQRGNGEMAVEAFGILRDGFDILFPGGHVYKDEIQPYTLGVHARGCGDTYLDTTNYVVSPEAIAKYYKKEIDDVNFLDTITYVDDRIVDELALEMTFEGNRFTDLIRFAEHRESRGQDGKAFLAGKVASRKGTEKRDDALYDKLSKDKTYWYLPLK